MNLHRKSAKHVKMNRASFVSQNFFKGLQQIGETEILSRENVPYTMYKLKPYTCKSCLLPYFINFNFE